MGFLRDYLSGAGQIKIYQQYFERLGIPLSSQALIEIWERGVRPQWEIMVQEQKNRFQIIYRSRPAETIDVRLREFASEAVLVHEDVLGSWSVKIEEAVRFRNVQKSKTGAETSRSAARTNSENAASGSRDPQSETLSEF